jgi:hypothetical protein
MAMLSRVLDVFRGGAGTLLGRVFGSRWLVLFMVHLFCCSLLLACHTRRLSDLPAHVLRAWVCARIPQVPIDARYWAVHWASKTIVTDEDPEEFDEFVPNADIVYIYDSRARAESVNMFPIPYNDISCDEPGAVLPRAVDVGPTLPHAHENPLRNAQWDPLVTTIDDVSPSNFRFVASTQNASGPEIIRVCMHPPDVRKDADEWLFTTEKAGASYTRDPDLYARLRAGAKRVFIYDPDAPAESVLRFPAPHNKLRCPGKSFTQEIETPENKLQEQADFEATVQAFTAKARQLEFGNGQGDKSTWTSSADGQGQSLSMFEAVVRQMVIAGALNGSDTSGALKNPNGSRYGIPQGTNIGGPDSLGLQFVAGTFMMLSTPLRSTGAFIRKVGSALKRRGVLIITDPRLMPKKLAEQMVEKFGQSMAPSLHQTKTILPHSRMEMFSKGWFYVYQSHHILESTMAKKILKFSNTDDLPAIILRDFEHKKYTNALRDARKAFLKTNGREVATPQEL